MLVIWNDRKLFLYAKPALQANQRGRFDGAYYSIGQAIWEDDASIKSGSLAQLIHKNVPGRNQTDHHGSGTSEVGCGRVTLLCLTRHLSVHWLKLSRGSTMETRVSYGITAQGSAQTFRKATLVDARRWS